MFSVTFFNGFRRWIFGGFCSRRRIQRFRTYRAIPRFSFVFLGLVSVVCLFLMVSVAFVYVFRYFVSMVSVTCFMVSVARFLVDSAAAGGSNKLEGIERFLVFCCWCF